MNSTKVPLKVFPVVFLVKMKEPITNILVIYITIVFH